MKSTRNCPQQGYWAAGKLWNGGVGLSRERAFGTNACFTHQQFLVGCLPSVVSLKCKIIILGRVPGFSPQDPVSQCSLLPGHLEQKRSQDPVSVQMFNVYGNGLGWFTKANHPPPFHSSGPILAIPGFSSLFPTPLLGRLAEKPLPHISVSHGFHTICEAISMWTKKKKHIPSWSLGDLT